MSGGPIRVWKWSRPTGPNQEKNGVFQGMGSYNPQCLGHLQENILVSAASNSSRTSKSLTLRFVNTILVYKIIPSCSWLYCKRKNNSGLDWCCRADEDFKKVLVRGGNKKRGVYCIFWILLSEWSHAIVSELVPPDNTNCMLHWYRFLVHSMELPISLHWFCSFPPLYISVPNNYISP